MTISAICDWCQRSFSRPVWEYQQCHPKHVKPTLAQQIVMDIENDLSDRYGLKHEWGQVEPRIQDDIRDTWAAIIERRLNETTNPPTPAGRTEETARCD